MLEVLGLDTGFARLVEEAVTLGYGGESGGVSYMLRWVVSRILLNTGKLSVDHIGDSQIAELTRALHAFSERPDVALFHGSAQQYQHDLESCLSALYTLRVLLHHRGQVSQEPRKRPRSTTQPSLGRPRLEIVIARYLAARRLDSEPTTVETIELSLRRFGVWLVARHPEINSFGEVTREHVLEFAQALSVTSPLSPRPLGVAARRLTLSILKVFFQEIWRQGSPDVPDQPLLESGDLPELPARVPRFIPAEELARLMEAIRGLECPYQQAALLIARWSGARRSEIRRLPLDCLDAYPDGTPRLRIPAGKSKKERVIPLNEEAPGAIRELQASHRQERGLRDPKTGIVTRLLFVRRGHLLSSEYLFEDGLSIACRQAGLVSADAKPTITAHRFRHSVGTQLAERGAKLHTIMKVLGHQSPRMAIVYTHISDAEVLKDYQAALGPGALIAGPMAETLQSGRLSASDIDWLKSNFLKTALELGHCLRLPQQAFTLRRYCCRQQKRCIGGRLPARSRLVRIRAERR